jgi:hypothetical protein
MTDDQFWTFLEAHVVVDEHRDVDVEGLGDALERLPLDEIRAFDDAFARMFHRSYTWPLWGAAYLINGGCSDDGFDYFRGWLIGQGRTTFEAALRDPDSLADHALPDLACEDILYVASAAYKAVAGQEMPADVRPFPDLGPGWDFDDDKEMGRRYPRLHAAFAGGA